MRCRIASRLCLSLGHSRVDAARAAVQAVPDAVSAVELRLDRLEPSEIRSGAWRGLPHDFGREWIATWRSPEEGGEAGPCPGGILNSALEAGFRWADVEAARLARGEPDAVAVAPDRRWVSAHPAQAPRSLQELRGIWQAVQSHPGALHKLAVPAYRFDVNTWIAELDAELDPDAAGTRTIFALGWMGHVSRILGRRAGHGVTYLSPEDAAATAPGQPSVARALSVYRLDCLAGTARLYGVLGNPARDSRSPWIHNAAFRESGHDGVYVALEAEAADPVLEWMRDGRLRGLSVTAPFKQDVAARMDTLEEGAARSGSVNTVFLREGRLWGADTDAEAMAGILEELEVGDGDPVAVFGAGGAARAVVAAAQDLGLAVTVFNRHASRGASMARSLGSGWGGDGTACVPDQFRLLVNTRPPGSGVPFEQPPGTRSRPPVIVDLGYGARPTEWEELARQAGWPYRGGLEFLARQAVGQLARWTDRPPAWERLWAALQGSEENPGR